MLNTVFGFEFAHHGVQIHGFLAKLEHIKLTGVRDDSGVRTSGLAGADDDVQVWAGEDGGVRVAFAVEGQEDLDRFGSQSEFGSPRLEGGRVSWADKPRVPNVVRFDLQGHVADDHGIGSGSQETHQPGVVFLKAADVSPTDLTGHREADSTVSRTDKVDEGVRAIPGVRRVPIPAVNLSPVFGNAGRGSSVKVEANFKRAAGADWLRNTGLCRHESIYWNFQFSVSARAYGLKFHDWVFITEPSIIWDPMPVLARAYCDTPLRKTLYP